MDIQARLFELQDEKYADFSAKLTPGIPRETFIGVRIPALRKLAKEVAKDPACEEFLAAVPHAFYDENLLHVLLLSQIKDYDEALAGIQAFLPYIDNWAVCDILSPVAFKKHHDDIMKLIPSWIKSPETYTCRFGMGMLMSHFLDDDFKPEYLEMPAAVRSEEYYVNMMTAWFFATALAKQWDATIPYLENQRLDKWTHNKTIQKGVESFRITNEQKDYLRSLRRKQ